MNVLIISSASININDNYVNIAKKISKFLAKENCDLVFGSSSMSMMGACYQEFIKNGRRVYAFTNDEYVDSLTKLTEATSKVVMTTFDLKKKMYEKSDLVVCLAGGIGTISELLSYVEENRTNNKPKKIIIYDETNFYNNLFSQLKVMVDAGFINREIIDSLKITNNIEQFKKQFYEIKESILI